MEDLAEASRGEGMATRGAWTRGARAEATEGATAGAMAAAVGRVVLQTRGAPGRTTAGRAGEMTGETEAGTLTTTGGGEGAPAKGGTGTRPLLHLSEKQVGRLNGQREGSGWLVTRVWNALEFTAGNVAKAFSRVLPCTNNKAAARVQ